MLRPRIREEIRMREGCPSVVEARALWLDDLLLARKAASTIQGYRSSTRALESLTPESARNVIRAYIGSNTALLAWAALRSLSACAHAHGWGDFMAGVPCPKKQERPHKYLSPDELHRVYAAFESDRELLIVRLFLTGVRASELLQIAPEGVQDAAVRIRGKGGK